MFCRICMSSSRFNLRHKLDGLTDSSLSLRRVISLRDTEAWVLGSWPVGFRRVPRRFQSQTLCFGDAQLVVGNLGGSIFRLRPRLSRFERMLLSWCPAQFSLLSTPAGVPVRHAFLLGSIHPVPLLEPGANRLEQANPIRLFSCQRFWLPKNDARRAQLFRRTAAELPRR